MSKKINKSIALALATTISLVSANTFAAKNSDNCKTLLNAIGGQSGLSSALNGSVYASGGPSNGGLDFNMWATVVSADGTVCAVTKTGNSNNAQWLGSRVISAQKANTANAFSLQGGLALSTANLWAATQPGASLFGLQFSNPVDTSTAYKGNSKKFGTKNDPMTGGRIGGVNVFGGGLALYNAEGDMIGGLGVSGDTSCADHNVAWRTRDALGLDFVPAGLSGDAADNIIYDLEDAVPSGFGHPTCLGTEDTVNDQIILDHPIGS
jgi:uncharacterized protein GlcG (DUF336 family)